MKSQTHYLITDDELYRISGLLSLVDLAITEILEHRRICYPPKEEENSVAAENLESSVRNILKV